MTAAVKPSAGSMGRHTPEPPSPLENSTAPHAQPAHNTSACPRPQEATSAGAAAYPHDPVPPAASLDAPASPTQDIDFSSLLSSRNLQILWGLNGVMGLLGVLVAVASGVLLAGMVAGLLGMLIMAVLAFLAMADLL